MIHLSGKGLVKVKKDPRDYQLMGARPGGVSVDFTKEFRLPEPPDEDQGSSLSCTWQGFSYYFWQWTGIQLSRQDGYSQTVLPGGGGYAVDPYKKMKQGCFTRLQHQDPNPETEANMTVLVKIGDTRRAFNVTFWQPQDMSIDGIAWAISNYKGCTICIDGYNGQQDWTKPEPPSKQHPSEWSHMLYAMGYGMVDGQKAILCKSSWCGWVKYHWIKENYFTSGSVFAPYVMETKEMANPFVELINNKGKVGVITYIDVPENLVYESKKYGIDLPKKTDGSIDWDKVQYGVKL